LSPRIKRFLLSLVFSLVLCCRLEVLRVVVKVPGPARRQRPLTNTTNTLPPSRSYLGGDEGSLGEAATDQLANECLPEGGLESSGAQVAPIFLVPEG